MRKTIPFAMATVIYFSFVGAIGAEAAPVKNTIPAPSAQSETTFDASNGPELRRNAMSLELLGRGLLYSFNYDYLLKDNLAVGAGISNYSFSSGASSASAWIIPVYANYYLTGGKHRWFGSAGANLIFANSKGFSDDSRVSGSGVAGVIGGGYEFRAASGFLFRAAPYVFVGKSSGAWLGVSFGYTI